MQVGRRDARRAPRAGMPLDDSIVDFLRPKQLLVVLDNCEHLLDAAGRLVDGDAPGLPRACASSRRAARASRSTVSRSSAVAIAAGCPSRPRHRDRWPTATRSRLFVERGAAARAGFALDDANAAPSPRSAAGSTGSRSRSSWPRRAVSAMSPAEIAARLDERFRLLTGGRAAAVERHQTLRATVDWSYSLLGDRERSVFDRLGVFAASFDAGGRNRGRRGDGVEPWDVLDALRDLVAKSMVVADETPHGTTRYQLLETLRQYARERLDEQGDTDRFRRRHAELFAEFAEHAGPGLLGPDELRWRAAPAASSSTTCAPRSRGRSTPTIPGPRARAAHHRRALVPGCRGPRLRDLDVGRARIARTSDAARPELRAGVLGAAAWDAGDAARLRPRARARGQRHRPRR